MRRIITLAAVVVLVLSACGGDDASTSDSDSSSGDSGSQGAPAGGDVADRQPAGQATVTVDGQEFTLTEPGALECTVTPDAITFSFRIGDNEITLGAGANLYDAGWLGSIDLRIANPAGEAGPVNYFPDLATNGVGIVVDGDSMSYSGPMQKQPANDGTNPPPVDVGDGTISVTCG